MVTELRRNEILQLMQKTYLLSLLFCLLVLDIAAQSTSISGRVIEKETGDPILFGAVVLTKIRLLSLEQKPILMATIVLLISRQDCMMWRQHTWGLKRSELKMYLY